MSLTSETVKKLRQPFAPEHIRWKIQSNPKDGEGEKYAVVVVFVDARTVAAHLDDVAPGQWTTEYTLPPITVGHPALECRLTVCGVTRADVGTVEPSKSDDSDTKDLYSDALKRAAVQFGIGSFLYRFPQVRAKVEQFGRTWYITREAQADLKALTQTVLSGADRLPNFKSLKVSGYNPDGMAALVGNEEQGPPPIGEERAHKLRAQLSAMLKDTVHREKTHTAFAGEVLGFEVRHISELTEPEAATVYKAARAAEQEGKQSAA